jgi:hypothetical protein
MREKDRHRVLELCKLVATEPDPRKLGHLIAELARVLEETDSKPEAGPDPLDQVSEEPT